MGKRRITKKEHYEIRWKQGKTEMAHALEYEHVEQAKHMRNKLFPSAKVFKVITTKEVIRID